MGNRFFNDRIKKAHGKFTRTWGNVPGNGRWWKRQLSKARRRYINALLRSGRGKEPIGLESEVNWKGW